MEVNEMKAFMGLIWFMIYLGTAVLIWKTIIFGF